MQRQVEREQANFNTELSQKQKGGNRKAINTKRK